MRRTDPDKALYPIYDLSNPHFAEVEVVTAGNEQLRGQFVRYKVASGKVEYLHPSEKYCFLPRAHQKEFWSAFNSNDGAFASEPPYIRFLSLSDIREIRITPRTIL